MHSTTRWRVARAAICAVALLAQAAAVPLLHACHASLGCAAGMLESASGAMARRGAEAVCEMRAADPPADAHDVASCPICATLAHGRAGVVPVVLAAAAPRAAHGTAVLTAAGGGDAPDLTRGGPRAPPALFS